MHLKQQRKDTTGTGYVNRIRILELEFRPSLLSMQIILSVLNCKIWSSLNHALCSGYMRCKHLKFCWSTTLEDIFLQRFYMEKKCFDKPEPLCRHISLAVKFHLAKKRKKRKSVLLGYSANQVLSILFKSLQTRFEISAWNDIWFCNVMVLKSKSYSRHFSVTAKLKYTSKFPNIS